ncbi:LLM class flavin-dependent oxidoreductase, partial [Tsukamurella spumae]|nr:LLM class flavin-dependent oxidoreductase [Tsukamurella spumae]
LPPPTPSGPPRPVDARRIRDDHQHSRLSGMTPTLSPDRAAVPAPLLAMALLTATEHIGVISTFHTTHHKPAHVARMGATLDAFSEGRWGWNVVTGFSADEAALFGEEFVEHDKRYDMASEFTDIVIRLWNEIEPIDVNGDYYQVRGRIKKPRTMQAPTPLLVSAGASPAGTAFAARFCDQLVTLASDEEALRAVDARLSEATAATGRTVATCPFAIALVRDEEGRAEEEWERLRASINPEATREIAADVLGSIESSRAQYAKMGDEQATMAFGGAGSMLKLIGTPDQVAEKLVSIKKNTAASNILINFPLWSAQEIEGFAPVVDRLRDAGIWTPPAARDYSW